MMNFYPLLLIFIAVLSSQASPGPESDSRKAGRTHGRAILYSETETTAKSAIQKENQTISSIEGCHLTAPLEIPVEPVPDDYQNPWEDFKGPHSSKSASNGKSFMLKGTDVSRKILREEQTSRGGAVKTLDEIYSVLREMSLGNEDVVHLLEFGKSYNGVPIYTVKIHRDGFPAVATMVVEFGAHAREWASPASAVYLIEQLLRERGRLIEEVQWFIVPVLNPDGYNHSTFENDMWRKNRRPLGKKDCSGVDLNRNFGVAWDTARSENECNEMYAGYEPFSELETVAVRDLVESIGPKFVDAYVAVHSCAQSILYPYGYQEKEPDQEKLQRLKEAGQKMADRMYEVRNQTYSVKQAAKLGVAGGGSDDFMFVHNHIPLVYTLELGDVPYLPDRKYNSCFHPNSTLTEFLTKECYAGLTALSEYVLYSKRNAIEPRIAPPPLSETSATHRISAVPEKLAFLVIRKLLPNQ